MDILITKRLTLRPPLEVDAEGLWKCLSNLNVSRMLSMVPHPYNLDDAKAYIAAKIQTPERCLYTVHRQTLIGGVGVHEHDQLELGYWFAEPFWGKGYASEAIRAVLSRAFQEFGASEIFSEAYTDNPASLRIMDKMGFERIGEETDYCKARDQHLPMIKTRLNRSAFEQRFGALDEARAA